MARHPVLGGGTLNPFAGGGIDFGAFNLLDPQNEAYLAFVKVETAWNAGHASNDEYLAALEKYANAQPAESADRVTITARLEQARYTIERNVLVDRVQNGKATAADLVAYDKGKLTGIVEDSQEYQQRLDMYRSSQAQLISDEEKKQVDLYQAGKLTTTQLRAWYQNVLHGPVIDRNPDLVKSLTDRIGELADRVQSEKDSKMLSDFQDGKVTTKDFLAYATSALSRYAPGTQQANDWKQRIQGARDNASETALLYRYNLSQQYGDLERFVKSNTGGGRGTSTSHSTRVVLGADGKWHSVTTSTTKAIKPSASEVAAHAKLLIEIADAKRQMAAIAKKVSGVGGFVASTSILKFYQSQLGKYARGSDAWYQLQGKIDNINSQIHQESVYGKEGIKITYPHLSSGGGGGGGGSAPHAASGGSGGGGGHTAAAKVSGPGGGGYSLGQFMRAIATQESGGRYDARNASTGAFGKYQILPSNWSSWAQKAGLSANAPQTPENQERVATAAFARLAKSYHNDWSRVAAAWFAGVAGSADPNHWGPRTQRYVDAIMSHMGTTRAAVAGGTVGSSGGQAGGSVAHVGSYAPSSSSSGGRAAGHKAAAPPTGGGSGPLSVITSVGAVHNRGGSHESIGTHAVGFPTGLDGRAFEKFYANYERAFESGAESFVDSSSGRAIAYYIGADPGDRIDRMRQLDDLRVSLYDTRAVAYQGTPSELTAMNQRNEAVKDVARHEYMIVDTADKYVSGGVGSAAIKMKTNPLGAGVRLLKKTSDAIKDTIAMAEAAYKRGDLTGAYGLFQMAKSLADGNGETMHLIADYVSAAETKLAGIERATGGISAEEALGVDKAGTLATDLTKLQNFDTELTSLFQGTPEQTLAELQSHLKVNADGSPVWDNPGDPRAQLVMTDDSYAHLLPNGDIKIESQPPTLHTGVQGYGDGTTVTVRVKSGNSVIQAQADYKVEEVGTFRDAATGQLFPIMGKVVRQKGADGKWTTFYENPLKPGSTTGWSDTPWQFAAPAGFRAVPDGKGGTIYTFTTPSGRVNRAGQAIPDGWTYKFVFDPKTGSYMIAGDKAGGLFESPQQDVPFGSVGDKDTAGLLDAAGFARIGGGAFDTKLPVFGMTQSEYDQYEKAFQPPALAAASKVEKYALDRATADLGDPSSIKARAYDKTGLDYAATVGDPSSIAARAYGKPGAGQYSLPAEAVAAGDPSSIAARAGLPALPTQRGGSPDDRAQAAQRAQLPRQMDPEARALQKPGRTVLPPPVKGKPPSKKYGTEPTPHTVPAGPKKRAGGTKPKRAPLPAVRPPPNRSTSSRTAAF